jgi:U2-associated protein SR140
LEKLLPDVFDHLNLIYRSFPGRIKAETFKKQICLIVNVWNSFMVFGQNSIDDFNERLVKLDVEDEQVQQAIDGEDVGIPLDDGEDVDGVAADESFSWAAEEPQAEGKSSVD